MTQITENRPQIHVKLKKMYGTDRFYPVNTDAQVLCDLMKVKSLIVEHLRFCKDNGWNISITQEDFEL